MKDWVKVGQSYTHGDVGIPLLSGDNDDSPPGIEDGVQASRSEGKKCKAADFFGFDDEPSPRKRSSWTSEDTDSGKDIETRHHKRGED